MESWPTAAACGMCLVSMVGSPTSILPALRWCCCELACSLASLSCHCLSAAARCPSSSSTCSSVHKHITDCPALLLGDPTTFGQRAI